MKNSAMIIVGLFVVIVVVTGALAVINRDAPMPKTDTMEKTEAMVKDETMVKDDNAEVVKADEGMMQKEGRYISFSPEMLASSVDSRRVLFFFANWCPTCKPADASFTNNVTQIPADVTVIRVNYNDTETDQAEKDLAKKYGVTYQHTFVQIDAMGNEVTKWNGGQISELLQNLK